MCIRDRTLPAASTATPAGDFNEELVAGPSMGSPRVPLPATNDRSPAAAYADVTDPAPRVTRSPVNATPARRLPRVVRLLSRCECPKPPTMTDPHLFGFRSIGRQLPIER